MSDNITHLTDATFEEVVNSAAEPVVVDFWAEWCGPCKMIAPILEEIALEQEGKLRITKLNVDENPNTSLKYQVMSIPTMLMFENGEVTKTIIGAKPKAMLMQELGL